MKKRINELARELEVKPGVILSMLPQLGVTEKKTHSSSVDEDVAELIKQRLHSMGGAAAANLAHVDDDHEVDTHDHGDEGAAELEESPTQEAARPNSPTSVIEQQHTLPLSVAAKVLPVERENSAAPATQPAPPAVIPETPAVAAAPPVEAPRPPAPAPGTPITPSSMRPLPIRPPLAGPGHRATPITPPLSGRPPAMPVRPPSRPTPPPPTPATAPATPAAAPPAPPVRPTPPPPAAVMVPGAPVAPPEKPAPAPPRPQAAAPGTPLPLAPPVAVIAPGPPATPQPPRHAAPPATPHAPERPAPPSPPVPRPSATAPRPGQILTGPRAPMPAGVTVPGIPRPPAPPPQRPAQPPQHQQQGQQREGGGLHQPMQPRPQSPTRPPLAGQPAARPVVPPRPDLLAKLTQTPQRATPGQPAAPRPPAPRPGMPTPGQPIYRGPRPGGPGGGYGRPPGPGGPVGGYGGRPPLRGRGMHPTTPLPMELPPTTDPSRRDAPKRRTPQRDREYDREGKLLPMHRKSSEPVAPPPIDREITISEGITVKELSEKLGVKASLVIKKLVDRKIFATINQAMDVKLAEDVAREFGASTNKVTYEQESTQDVELTEVAGDMTTRPPVVTIMGHVDHGKTSLLDAIRHTSVAAREAGGITQHIGAYHVEVNGRKIVFIDTPGHEAFTRMRARGSKVTDIVILVVAADDGIMPQTREAIDHARVAKVPIIVAMNKIDKPDAQPERVKQQLTEVGLMPEEWGGETPLVPVSAKTQQNLELLLEMILLVADLQDLKGNPARPAVATVLEAQLDKGRGPVATVLVRNGTVRVGDHFLCGSVFGRVRALFDDRQQPVKEAGPSIPVQVLGLESMPDVGDNFQVVTDVAKARQIADFREIKTREQAMLKTRITLEQFHAQLREGESKELNVIIKADVGGTAEVLSDTLQKLSTEKVSIRVLSTGVGAITESDVLLATTSNAIIIGFNVRPERNAVAVAEQEGVDIRLHTIIYELTDEIKKAMVGLLEPVIKETYKGRAEVRETFRITKVGTVAGCYVQDGSITRDSEVRLLRDNIVIHTGRIDALKRFKNDASEVKSGFECGISLVGYNDIKSGDIIEAFVKERIVPDSLT